MTEDRKTKMLEKVRALLAKAEGAAAVGSHAEAETFREGADRLMTNYAIEAWEVEMAKEGSQRSIRPEKREFSWAWYLDMDYQSPIRSALWSLWLATARHCRVISVSGKADYRGKVIPVVGMPADLDYFDMMFTSLMIQMIQAADPRPDSRLSLEENLAAMREAGMGWDTVTRRLIEAGMIEDPNPGVSFPRDRADWKHYCRERFLLSERLVRKYRTWCKETGREQTYTNVSTYQKHFAAGFSGEIDNRLWRMAQMSEQAYDSSHDSGGAALAIRDIKIVVKEALWDFYPELRPHPPECECDNCHVAKCTDSECDRPRCKERRKPVRYRTFKEPVVDRQARSAGREAGARANLTGKPSHGLRQTPEIGR